MEYNDDQLEFEDEDRGPSRSAQKREAEALQALGAELVALPPARLKEVPLDAELREAVELAQRIKAHGGRRRQLQLIGKLMRQTEPEPIRDALDRIHNRSAAAVAEHHAAERWRERLLTEGDAVLAEFLDQHPGADAQRLRQLIRNARQEQGAGKPPRAARDLFRAIRDVLGS